MNKLFCIRLQRRKEETKDVLLYGFMFYMLPKFVDAVMGNPSGAAMNPCVVSSMDASVFCVWK